MHLNKKTPMSSGPQSYSTLASGFHNTDTQAHGPMYR